MSMIPETIFESSDVGYLLIMLSVASAKGDEDIKEAVISRLQSIGFLHGEDGDRNQQKENLKALVDKIVERHGRDRP